MFIALSILTVALVTNGVVSYLLYKAVMQHETDLRNISAGVNHNTRQVSGALGRIFAELGLDAHIVSATSEEELERKLNPLREKSDNGTVH